MGAYRLSRNTEASFIDYLKAQLIADGWSGVRVEKAFSEVYGGTLPCLCILSPERIVQRQEIGTDTLLKYISVDFRIFATSDGQRLDLADWMLEKLIVGVPYYQYTIANGTIQTKTLIGRIQVLRVTDNRKELTNTENLSQEDRYRHLIACECHVALL